MNRQNYFKKVKISRRIINFFNIMFTIRVKFFPHCIFPFRVSQNSDRIYLMRKIKWKIGFSIKFCTSTLRLKIFVHCGNFSNSWCREIRISCFISQNEENLATNMSMVIEQLKINEKKKMRFSFTVCTNFTNFSKSVRN